MVVESNSGPIELPDEVRAINVGLASFGEAVREQGGEAVDVEWRIPAGGDPDLVRALTRLHGARAEVVEEANREVLRRLDESSPVLAGVEPARERVPEMGERTILHPGPPLAWEAFCDPLRRSVHAAVMAEGWAETPEEAAKLVAGGEVELEPANHHDTVLPMATALSPSAPVLVVENPQGETTAFSAINQGPGKQAWFGVDAPEAVERLVFLREVAGPVLDAAIRVLPDPLDIFSLASQALQMGDDAHMRSQAATNLTIRYLMPCLAELEDPRRVETSRFLSENHLFFLTMAMAAAKATTMWATHVEGSSIVTVMSRNGTTFGVRLPGIDRWFVAPAPPVEDALFHGDYGPEDAAPDIGDSAILELVGLGGASAAASPAVAAFVGGTMADAVEATREMERICFGRSSRFKLPYLGFAGSPLGVDVRLAVETEVTPSINTGILHRSDGVGQVGAGVAHAPIECFRDALLALDSSLHR
jgi:hypothetical protein